MARIKLTKRTVDALSTTRSRGERFFDTEVPGFYLAVYPNRYENDTLVERGSRAFGVIFGPKRRSYRIGPYGTWTVETARDRAAQILRGVETGADPRADRKSKESIPTFGEWVDAHLERLKPRIKSYKETERYLKIAKESWGARRLDSLSLEDVETAYKKMQERGVTSANRWFTAVRACFEAARKRKKILANPAEDLERLPENPPRTRVLTDNELKAVLDAVSGLKDAYARTALRVLIETGARRSEILRAKWEDVDLEERVWRLPSPKAGKPQVIPLTDNTVALLRNLPRREGCAFIIPGRRRKKGEAPQKGRFDLKKPWETVRIEAKLEGVRLHDLRRTFGLHVARKAGLHVSSRILRHSSVKVTEQVYAPLGIEELRNAMEGVHQEREKVLSVIRGSENG